EVDVRELRRDGAPVAVAHGGVEAAHDLDAVDPDVTQVGPFQLGREWACANRRALRRRLVPAVPAFVPGRLPHGQRSYRTPNDRITGRRGLRATRSRGAPLSICRLTPECEVDLFRGSQTTT